MMSTKNITPIAMAAQKPRKLFPPWRLVNGLKATNEELEDSEGVCERWAWGCGGLVFVGLIIEIGLALLHPPYGGIWEVWGTAAADTVVALGVGGEVLFAMMAFTRQGELSRRSNERVAQLEYDSRFSEERAAQALERAAKAERETEKLRAVAAWRRLDEKQHTALALALRNSGPGASLQISVVMSDQESLNFAQLISIPFRAAGWRVGYRFSSYKHGIMTGILVPEISENHIEEVKSINARVREAFIEANIAFVNGWPEYPYMTTDDNTPLVAPIASLYVGPKSMPAL